MMKSRSVHISLVCFIFIVLLSHPLPSTTAQEVEDEREFDYASIGQKGPQRWGELKKEWEACKTGGMQSPIDLSSRRVKVVKTLGKRERNYKPSNATVKNRGHDISVKWDLGKAGSININGTEYLLQQAHWHSPSEHTLNGRRYDMELHMVHLHKPNVHSEYKIAVIGVFFQLGQPDSFLSKLMGDIKAMSDKLEKRHKGVIDPRDIKLGGKKYYAYMGSLTVPPCSEGVIWTINKKIRTVSREQVKQLRSAVHDFAEQNSRPVQAINRRDIHLINGGTPL